jgi:hypothetical protein
MIQHMRIDSGTDTRLIEVEIIASGIFFLSVMSHLMIRSRACLRPRPHFRRVRIHQRGPAFSDTNLLLKPVRSWFLGGLFLGLNQHPLLMLLTLVRPPSRPPLTPPVPGPSPILAKTLDLFILIPFRLRQPQALCSSCFPRVLLPCQLRVSSLLTLSHTHLSTVFVFPDFLPHHVRFYSSRSLSRGDWIILSKTHHSLKTIKG